MSTSAHRQYLLRHPPRGNRTSLTDECSNGFLTRSVMPIADIAAECDPVDTLYAILVADRGATRGFGARLRC